MDKQDKPGIAMILGAFVAALLAVFLIQTEGDVTQLPYAIFNWITGGRRLTRTTLNANGDVDVPPDVLTAQASAVVGRTVGRNAYALARMLDSEEPNSSHNTRVAIAWVAINEAKRRGVSVADLLLKDNGPGNGKFGEQLGRYASTRNDPHEGALQIAEQTLTGAVPDITNGAIHFYRPKLQDKLYALGKVRKTAAEVDNDWGGNGYAVQGTDSGLKFYS